MPQPPQAPGAYGRAPGVATSRVTQEAIRKWREGRGIPSYGTRQEQLGAAAMNEALQFMDPTTRGQFMRQMARDMPMVFGGYAGAKTPAPPTGQAATAYGDQMLSAERLGQAIKALSPSAVVGALGKGLPKTQAQRMKEQYITEEAQGPLGFLSDYLRTAQQAYGTGVGRATRAQRQYSERRLGELGQQAQERPEFGAMAQLGQALVNPALTRAPTSGGLGTYRSTVTPQAKPQRAGMFRAGELT